MSSSRCYICNNNAVELFGGKYYCRDCARKTFPKYRKLEELERDSFSLPLRCPFCNEERYRQKGDLALHIVNETIRGNGNLVDVLTAAVCKVADKLAEMIAENEKRPKV